MSTRAQDMEGPRVARLAVAECQRLADRRQRRLRTLLGAGLAAAIAVVVAIVISTTSSKGAEPRTPAQTSALFAGVAQDGFALGRPDAPVTLEEFADLQCSYCRGYEERTLGVLVRRYVRPGRLRMVFHHFVVLGPDSRRAAAVAVAAAEQGRGWQFLDRFYAHQQAEGSGYVTGPFLRRVAGEVRGLDVDRALRLGATPGVAARVAADGALARRAGFTGTPSFLLHRTGEPPRPLPGTQLEPDRFTGPIDALLRR